VKNISLPNGFALKNMIHGEPSLEGFSMNRHGLRGDQFARIKKLLPGRPGSVGRDIRRGCDLEVSDRRSLARYAGAFRRGRRSAEQTAGHPDPDRQMGVEVGCLIVGASNRRT
jgi:hypothetical protein